jgi:hypothetical protein
MSKKMQLGTIVGATLMVSAMSAAVHAEVSPFMTQDIAVSMQLAENAEGKCGGEAKGDHEGKCGESSATPAPGAHGEGEAHGAKGE